MGDPPYTSPDEDPFSASPIRRRRSSLLDRWIRDQQLATSSSAVHKPSDTRPNPWLAYPDISKLEIREDVSTLHSYDLVDDPDIPRILTTKPSDTKINATGSPGASKCLHSPSLRSLSLNLRPATPNSSSSTPFTPPPKKSFFNLPESLSSRYPLGHQRSASLSTPQGNSESLRLPSAGSRKWRPSVLGHFPASSHLAVQDTDAPPRPSLSSIRTGTSANSTSYFGRDASNPSELSLVSSRPLRRLSHGASSSLSFFSQTYTHTDERSSGSYTLSSRSGRRTPLKDKYRPNDSFDGSSPPSADRKNPIVIPTLRKTTSKIHLPNLSPRPRRKKLVISGIPPEDDLKLEAARRWCESFGELRSIVRQRNGDLHISFRSSEVADTVCRLRKQVYITNVGSVQLSWFVGSGRP